MTVQCIIERSELRQQSGARNIHQYFSNQAQFSFQIQFDLNRQYVNIFLWYFSGLPLDLENLEKPWISRFLRPRILKNPKYPFFFNVTLFERLNCVALPLQVYDWLGCKFSLSELFLFPVNILLSKFISENFSFLYCIDSK